MAKKHQTKYIFVTGGVISSLGKGIAAGSIGAILESRGLDVSIIKLDPYLNVDPGTMNPFQHGEVFVTDDGAETDLDLGHYERFISSKLSKLNSKSAGQIYQTVLEKERQGKYLGATVQVIPHVTDEIKAAIREASPNHDILICEVGGTVGDIESLPFIEAIRQMRRDEGSENTLFIHVSYLPMVHVAGEIKTKPTQHSVKELLSIGIQPDVLLLRAEKPVPTQIKSKISLFCNVPVKGVISCPDAETIYEVPLILEEEGVDSIVLEKLNIWARKPKLKGWKRIVERIKNPKHEVNIGIVGKYVHLVESYKSINEALAHAGLSQQIKINFDFIDSVTLEKNDSNKRFEGIDGILVPGGFGERGTKGKIKAAKFARENNIPFFGICLGLQIAVVEFARHVAKITNAASEEIVSEDKSLESHNVIHIMEHQKQIKNKGGTMRLGLYPCVLKKGSLANKIYQEEEISERHRHRYEINNKYRDKLEKAGLSFSGLSPDGNLVEIIELEDHPFYIACQFHPEFLSRPLAPHPMFLAFVKAVLNKRKSNVAK